MFLYDVEQIRAWDQFTIEQEPVLSIDLMERASGQLVKELLIDYPEADHYYVVCGPGNNGGDGLAIARMLQDSGRNVTVYLFDNGSELSPDNQVNKNKLSDIIHNDYQAWEKPKTGKNDVLIDALLGSGLRSALRGNFRDLVENLNRQKGIKVAVDIPTGLPADEIAGENHVAFYADQVYSFQIPKRSFLFLEHQHHFANFRVLDIGLHKEYKATSLFTYLQEGQVSLPPRNRFSHKGTFGKVLLIGGSYGMGGAIMLAGKAALRSGCGLCTLALPASPVSATHAYLPEATLIVDPDKNNITEIPETAGFNAIGIGPGLAQHKDSQKAVNKILDSCSKPMVIDADALNCIAANRWQDRIPKGTVITPHPREFERLFGATNNSLEAIELQIRKSRELGIVIVYKGAHTRISHPDGRMAFNSTGNSGMAKGGSGDILTGIIASLLASGMDAYKAACCGVFYHGKAGDKALQLRSERNMIASDIIDQLFR